MSSHADEKPSKTKTEGEIPVKREPKSEEASMNDAIASEEDDKPRVRDHLERKILEMKEEKFAELSFDCPNLDEFSVDIEEEIKEEEDDEESVGNPDHAKE